MLLHFTYTDILDDLNISSNEKSIVIQREYKNETIKAVHKLFVLKQKENYF